MRFWRRRNAVNPLRRSRSETNLTDESDHLGSGHTSAPVSEFGHIQREFRQHSSGNRRNQRDSSSPERYEMAALGDGSPHDRSVKALADNDLIFKGEGVESYLRRFEHFAELNGLSERESVKYLLTGLRGPALEWYLCRKGPLIAEAEERAADEALLDGNPSVARGVQAFTYQFLKEHLIKRYQTRNRKLVAQCDLGTLTQQPNESISEFMARLQQVGHVANGHLSDEDRQDSLISHLIRGIRDRDTKMHVIATNPRTLEAAYETAISLEASKNLVKHTTLLGNETQSSRQPYAGTGHTEGSRRNQLNNISGTGRAPNRQSGWTTDGRVVCRYCNKLGHYERECRAKLRDSQNRHARNTPVRGYDDRRGHWENAYHVRAGNAQYHQEHRPFENRGSVMRNQAHRQQVNPSYRPSHYPQGTLRRDNNNAHLGSNASGQGRSQANAIVTEVTQQEGTILSQNQEGHTDLKEIMTLLKSQQQDLQNIKRQIEDPYGMSNTVNLIATEPTQELDKSIERQVSTCEIGIQVDPMELNLHHNPRLSPSFALPIRKKKAFRYNRRAVNEGQHRKRKSEAESNNVTVTDQENNCSGYAYRCKEPWRNKNPFHSFTIASLFMIMICIPLGTVQGTASDNYKQTFFMCRPARGGIPITPPKPTVCPSLYNLNGPYEYKHYEVWVPKPPATTEAQQCFIRNRTVCTNPGINHNMRDEAIETSLNPSACRKAWKTKRWHDKRLMQVVTGAYSTNSSAEETDSGCITVSNLILQLGTVGLNRDGSMFSSLNQMHGCEQDLGYCQTEHNTILWEAQKLTETGCPYEKEKFLYLGEKKGNFVRLYKLPQIISIASGPLPACVPQRAKLTKEHIILQEFSTWNRTSILTGSNINQETRDNNIMQVTCEIHQRQRSLISFLLDIDPTLGLRLAFQRNDIQAIWQGNTLLASACNKVEVERDKIHYDHRIEDTCFYYMPVNVNNKWLFASHTGELFTESAKIPCTMVRETNEETGENLNHSQMNAAFDMSLPDLFYDRVPTFDLKYALTDFNEAINAPLFNTPFILQKAHYPEYNRNFWKYFPKEHQSAGPYKHNLYFVTSPTETFEHLIQDSIAKVFDISYWILNDTTQTIVNCVVVGLLFLKLFTCWCCCTCARFRKVLPCCKPGNTRRTRLREASIERREARRRHRHGSVSVLIIGPTKTVNVPIVQATVRGCQQRTLIDTGATMSIISYDALMKLPRLPYKAKPFDFKAVTASGQRMPITHGIMVPIKLGPLSTVHFCGIMRNAPYDLILGTDAFLQFGITEVTYNLKTKGVRFDHHEIPALLDPNTPQAVNARETIQVAPRSWVRFSARLDEPCAAEKPVVFEPDENFYIRHGVLLTATLNSNREKCVAIEGVNLSGQTVNIYKGTQLGHVTPAARIASILPTRNRHQTTHFTLDQEMLDKVINGSALDAHQRAQIEELLKENADVFSQNDFDLGTCQLAEHHIDVQGHTPIQQHPYRMPFSQRAVMQRQIDGLLQAGVIRPSVSQWKFPCLLVKKKEAGEWRLVVDYRKLNGVIKVDQYNIPHIDDILHSLGKAKYFSSLDMCSGYHQIPVADEDKEKTAFGVWGIGLFEYCKMPMGISNAGACYQRAMDQILAGSLWKNTWAYLDDVLVASESFPEHLKHLKETFDRFRRANLKIKLRKCKFLREELPFLGYVVTKQGLRPDPAKIARVEQFPQPRNITELRTFLGLLSYYRRYIKNFGHIASPLHQLLRKDTKYAWTNKQEEAFHTLKAKLTTAPILAYPKFDQPFIVHTDASDKGVAAGLSQIGEDGLEHPIIYASRAIQKAEKSYGVTEKEGLAVVFALKCFRPYIYQHDTVLYTDHSALRCLLNTISPNARIARWALQVQEYIPKLEIKYRPGRTNGNADALSRSFPQEPIEQEAHLCNAIADIIDADTNQDEHNLSPTEQQIRAAQQSDPSLKQIITYLQNGELPVNQQEAKKVVIVSERYAIERGMLLYQPNEKLAQAVVALPTTMTCEILKIFHNDPLSGHLGIDKTYHRIKSRYYWPTIFQDVRKFCRNCLACATRKRPLHYFHAPMQPVSVDQPWELLGCDIIGPIKLTELGNRFIIVFCDYFSGWTEAFPTPDTTAETVARIYLDEIVCRFGAARQIRTDQGPQFCSELTEEIIKLCNSEHQLTPPYSPWCNGKVERTNGILGDILSQYTNGTDWDKYVRSACMAINSSVHSSTRQTPYFLMFGRDPILPTDAVLNYKPGKYQEEFTSSENILKHFSDIYAEAREQIHKAQLRQKRNYDRKASQPNLSVGELVLVKEPATNKNVANKFRHQWRNIYRIIEITSPNVTLLRTDRPKDTPRVVHMNNVKRFMGDNPEATSESEDEGSVEL